MSEIAQFLEDSMHSVVSKAAQNFAKEIKLYLNNEGDVEQVNLEKVRVELNKIDEEHYTVTIVDDMYDDQVKGWIRGIFMPNVLKKRRG